MHIKNMITVLLVTCLTMLAWMHANAQPIGSALTDGMGGIRTVIHTSAGLRDNPAGAAEVPLNTFSAEVGKWYTGILEDALSTGGAGYLHHFWGRVHVGLEYSLIRVGSWQGNRFDGTLAYGPWQSSAVGLRVHRRGFSLDRTRTRYLAGDRADDPLLASSSASAWDVDFGLQSTPLTDFTLGLEARNLLRSPLELSGDASDRPNLGWSAGLAWHPDWLTVALEAGSPGEGGAGSVEWRAGLETWVLAPTFALRTGWGPAGPSLGLSFRSTSKPAWQVDYTLLFTGTNLGVSSAVTHRIGFSMGYSIPEPDRRPDLVLVDAAVVRPLLDAWHPAEFRVAVANQGRDRVRDISLALWGRPVGGDSTWSLLGRTGFGELGRRETTRVTLSVSLTRSPRWELCFSADDTGKAHPGMGTLTEITRENNCSFITVDVDTGPPIRGRIALEPSRLEADSVVSVVTEDVWLPLLFFGARETLSAESLQVIRVLRRILADTLLRAERLEVQGYCDTLTDGPNEGWTAQSRRRWATGVLRRAFPEREVTDLARQNPVEGPSGGYNVPLSRETVTSLSEERRSVLVRLMRADDRETTPIARDSDFRLPGMRNVTIRVEVTALIPVRGYSLELEVPGSPPRSIGRGTGLPPTTLTLKSQDLSRTDLAALVAGEGLRVILAVTDSTGEVTRFPASLGGLWTPDGHSRREETWVLGLFGYDQSIPTTRSFADHILSNMRRFLAEGVPPGVEVIFSGESDALGTEAHNQGLRSARAGWGERTFRTSLAKALGIPDSGLDGWLREKGWTLRTSDKNLEESRETQSPRDRIVHRRVVARILVR